MAKKKSEVKPGFWMAWAKVTEVLVDKFGWPGAVLIFSMYYVERHASDEQRRAIVDMYVLGRGINVMYPVIILGVFFVGVTLAQSHRHRRKCRVLQNEIDRLANWKSAHQEKTAGGPLHHSKNAGE